ncbi:MAG: hypothetical protein Kow0069_30350 [Promethearchaeota archaeon]
MSVASVVLSLIVLGFLFLQGYAAGRVLVTSLKHRLANTALLGAGLLDAMVCTLLVYVAGLSWNDVAVPFMLAFYAAIPFTAFTFHRDRGRKRVVLALHVVGGTLLVAKVLAARWDAATGESLAELTSLLLEAALVALGFGWWSLSARRARLALSREGGGPMDPNLRSWVLSRLRAQQVGAGAMALNGLPQFLQVLWGVRIEEPEPLSIAILLALLAILGTFSACMVRAWCSGPKRDDGQEVGGA